MLRGILNRCLGLLILVSTLFCTSCQNLSGPWIGGVATGEQMDITNPPRPQMSYVEVQQSFEALLRDHGILGNPASVLVSPQTFTFIYPNNGRETYRVNDINRVYIQRSGDFLTSLYAVYIGPRSDILCNSYEGAHRLLTAIAALKYYNLQAVQQTRNSNRTIVTRTPPPQINPQPPASSVAPKVVPPSVQPSANSPSSNDLP